MGTLIIPDDISPAHGACTSSPVAPEGAAGYVMHHAALAPCCLSSSSSRPDIHRKNILKSLMKE